MQGNPAVIAALNKALSGELAAGPQYQAHEGVLENWGFRDLAAKVADRGGDERSHSQRAIVRILELEGVPAVSEIGPINVALADVPGQFEADKAAELQAVVDWAAVEQAARAAGDMKTLKMAIEIGAEEGEHLAEIEEWQDQHGMMGLAAFLTPRVKA